MADNAVLFKYLVKSVGMKHNIIPSFMAKPWGSVSRMPRTIHASYISNIASRLQWVCNIDDFWKIHSLRLGRHTHVSLRDKNGGNIFSVSKEQLRAGRSGAANEDTRFISHQAEMFLAGLLDGLPDGENIYTLHGS